MSTNPSYDLGTTPWIRTTKLKRTKENEYVTALLGGESIAYVVRDEDAATVDSGTSPGDVTHWSTEPGTWAARVDVLPAGQYEVEWTITVGGGVAVERDRFKITI